MTRFVFPDHETLRRAGVAAHPNANGVPSISPARRRKGKGRLAGGRESWRDAGAPTLGSSKKPRQPQRGCLGPRRTGCHPFRVGAEGGALTQGSAQRATLGWMTERRWRSPAARPLHLSCRSPTFGPRLGAKRPFAGRGGWHACCASDGA